MMLPHITFLGCEPAAPMATWLLLPRQTASSAALRTVVAPPPPPQARHFWAGPGSSGVATVHLNPRCHF